MKNPRLQIASVFICVHLWFFNCFAQTTPSNPQSAAPTKPKFCSGLVRPGVKSGRIAIDVDISGAKKLWLVVTEGGNGYACDWADWLEPKLIRPNGSALNLAKLKWKSATCGWGEIHLNKNCVGGPLQIDKRKWTDGIGTHAPSIIEYDLPENFSRFIAKAGIDNGGSEQTCEPQVEFLVFTEPPPANVLQTPTEAENHSGRAAAQESLKNFTVADGLEVSLFAAEPMLRNPTDMDIDERGRVWITEGVNYRSTFQPWGILDSRGDRIVILEDTNGDGAADKETTFYQGHDIDSALGICVLGNKVVVSRSPDVFVFTDSDGDGKADKKEILFTGIGGHEHDHGVHAFVFGPDGKLYFNFGNAGEQLKRPDGSPVLDLEGNEVSGKGKPFRMGMVFRCNPDGSEVEVLAHNFRNNYEIAVDSFGTLWQGDNDDDGNRAVRINYVMERGNYGYEDELTGAGWGQKRSNLEDEISRRHWHQNDPGAIPNLLITGAGAPTGITIYEGKLLPKIFQNQIIHCDAGPRVVRSYPVTPEGAGYKAEIVDILSTADSWFRPSDVCVAPDGSIFISDWNDAGVGGHNMADREFAKMTGRVYRVAPKGHKSFVPKNDFTGAQGCVKALQSPNNATRFLAWTAIHENQEKAEKELLKLWRGKDERLRARALQLLARLKGKEEKYLRQAVKDKNSDIRIEALRIARELKMDVIPFVQKLVRDSSPQVRRECAIALRHNSSDAAPQLWAELAAQHDGQDRWYLEALGLGADKNEEKFFQAWLNLAGSKWNTPAGRDIIWRSRAKSSAEFLAKLIGDAKVLEKERARYFRALDFIPSSAEKETALVNLLSLSAN